MKHYLITIFIILTISLCNSNIIFAQNCDTDISTNYRTTYIQVLKIDTMLDNYVIYAKTDTSQLKIVSWKCSVCCNNIFIGDRLLVSLIGEKDIFKTAMEFNMFDVAVTRGRDKITREYEWGGQLFFVKEIYGLCYTLNEETLKEYEQWLIKYLPSLKQFYKPYRKIKQPIK
jgi:hypothetical protein